LGNVENALRSCIDVLKKKEKEDRRSGRTRPTLLVYSTLPYGSSIRIREIFDDKSVAIDEDIGYCHMPLMIAQGTTASDFVNPPFLVFGSYSRPTAELMRSFYL